MSAEKSSLLVPTEKLRRNCEPVTVENLDHTASSFGQASALAAIDVGLQMMNDDYTSRHYNILVVGSSNTGRTARTIQFLSERAALENCQPHDVVAVNDFEHSRRFSVAFVPNGSAKMIEELLSDFSRIVVIQLTREIEEFRATKMSELQEIKMDILTNLRKKIQPHGLDLMQSEQGLVVIPISLTDSTKIMEPKEFDGLDEDIQAELRNRMTQGYEDLRLAHKKISELTGGMVKESIEYAATRTDELLEPLRNTIDDRPDFDEFRRFLQGLKETVSLYAAQPTANDPMLEESSENAEQNRSHMIMHVCKINILQDNSGVTTKPVVHVDVPQYSRLFGRINGEPSGRDSFHIDHTMVDSSAFIEANGGYLVFDLDDLLRWGGGIAFYKLLDVIRTRKIKIENKSSFVDVETLMSYCSNDIPIDVRVVAVISPRLEWLLRHHEPEFENLFRISSEFSAEMSAADAPQIYGQFVELCRSQGNLPEFTPEAIAKLVEYGLRRADNQNKCSTELGIIKDVVTEASHWSRQNGATQVLPCHVRQAIKERFKRRAMRILRYQEFMDSGYILLTHEGRHVGQINGLAVLGVSSDVMFGLPMRLTARCFAGKERVMLVQRKAKLTGKSTNMSIEDITGWLCGRWGRRKPLSLVAQLSFEQTYSGIDGDSASLAEAIAIVSSIAELPINQMGAITGSMNQWGEVQPIGGVNEKIEGHFGALKRRQLLKPGHFVAIPHQNVEQLMLDEEVIEAQKSGLYQVYALHTIEQALELFLEKPMAEIDRLVSEKLAEMNEEEENAGGKKKKSPKKKEEVTIQKRGHTHGLVFLISANFHPISLYPYKP
ncbi:MAG: AAA family ATPase [Patescibacteria group bacterium]